MAKILVIDEEEHIRNLYSEELSEAGYDVITASTPKVSRGIIANEKPGVVVSEVRFKIERNDGLDALCDIRSEYPNLPIIFNTTREVTLDYLKPYAPVYHVVKSMGFSELKDTIKLALEQNPWNKIYK